MVRVTSKSNSGIANRERVPLNIPQAQMADPLTRLASQIDAVVPQLSIFAVARWAGAILLSPSLRITSRFFPQLSDELRLVIYKTYCAINALGVV
eukprot:3938889-Prymnesium_polylepis.1